MKRIVIDTSVIISALIGQTGPSREVLRQCLQKKWQPIISNTLFNEYEDVSQRERVKALCPLSQGQITELLSALYSPMQWVAVSYLWRPNLKDEGDNFLIELAIAGNADCIITNNIKDFNRSELRFEQLQILTPEQFLQENS